MLKKTAFYAAFALTLGACTSQQPAPVVVGNAGSSTSSNPYGATPYGTNAPAANDAP